MTWLYSGITEVRLTLKQPVVILYNDGLLLFLRWFRCILKISLILSYSQNISVCHNPFPKGDSGGGLFLGEPSLISNMNRPY